MPTVTVYTIGGNVVWGPQQVSSPMLAKELAGLLDRPAGSPGLKLVHGDSILPLELDLGGLSDPADIRVQYDPPKPFDHSFCKELCDLSDTACDRAFFPGDTLEAEEFEVSSAQVLAVELLDDGFETEQSFFKVRMKIPDGSPLVLTTTDQEVQLQLAGVKFMGVAAERIEGASKEDMWDDDTGVERADGQVPSVRGKVHEKIEGGLVVEVCLALEFDEMTTHNLWSVEVLDGPVQRLQRLHASKAVREGVSYETGSVPLQLTSRLNELIDRLKAGSPPDYHPGSNNVVRDIVHPSLFPFIEGTSVLAGPQDWKVKAGRSSSLPKFDQWERPYEDSMYQWLPSEVSVSAAGRCTFDTYINGLDRDTNGPLYGALEELLGRCLPLLEVSWAHGRSVEPPKYPDDWESDASAGDPDHVQEMSLRGRTIQIITKIVDYELEPGGKHEGVWHVEGMSHENIVATAEFILQKGSSLSGGGLEFQRSFTKSEGGSMLARFPQCRPRTLDQVVRRGLVPLGQLQLPVGRLASWPNSHVHRVSELVNRGDITSTRRIVVFWLVNPDVRIVSTKHVAPQQSTMSLEEAHRHRLQLMEERKRHKENWNLREVTLCEH